MSTRTVAVVGHVDHGKSSIVTALTGVETDTQAEERRRGLTITLGFAPIVTDAGTINLIDAPGHADFLRSAVAGLSGVDAILLVVSSVDGIQAQTREHVEIARLLDVKTVVAALSKSDLASAAAIDELRAELSVWLNDSGFQHIDIVSCSATAPTRLEDLRRALNSLYGLPTHGQALAGFFLPVDRVFSVDGAGTVVTGTLLGKSISKGSPARFLPSEASIVVRGVQVNGKSVERAWPGERVAVNLKGRAASDISKGDVLSSAGTFAATNCFDVILKLAPIIDRPPKHMEQMTVLRGTGHVTARVRRYDANGDRPRSKLLARLEFDRPQIGFSGQQFILRRPSLAQTVAGGVILDAAPGALARNRRQHVAVLNAAAHGDVGEIASALSLRNSGAVLIEEVARLSRAAPAELADTLQLEFEVGASGMAIDRRIAAKVEGRFLEYLQACHAERPLRPIIPSADVANAFQDVNPSVLEAVERNLIRSRLVIKTASGAALASHDPLTAMSTDAAATLTRLEDNLRAVALRPIHENEIAVDVENRDDFIDCLIWSGRVVNLYNHALNQRVLLHADTVTLSANTLCEAFANEKVFSTSAARQLLATNRKVIVPLLEYFDQQGLTERIEGGRRWVSKQRGAGA
jgi:selenocysteine-specific elongation factor